MLVFVCGLLMACGAKSNVEPPSPLTDFSPTAQVKRIWSIRVGQGDSKRLVSLSPLVRNDIVYVADPSGRVSALAADSGKQIWQVETKIRIGGGGGFGDNKVGVEFKKWGPPPGGRTGNSALPFSPIKLIP